MGKVLENRSQKTMRLWDIVNSLLNCLAAMAFILVVFTGLLFWAKLYYVNGETDSHQLTTRRVLVTGAAGFIGFHVCRILLADTQNFVLAMDNFNDYYDVNLKLSRAEDLRKLGLTVEHEDVCNEIFLRMMIQRHNITHVVHMAAQAGVRQSLINPFSYITANVECFHVLLEVLKEFPSIKLLYASSSSVYGKSSQVPLDPSISLVLTSPNNMYAATKRTDEMLSNLYCREYNMSAVGLRFFTVYGPWGRPDMAIYKFVEAVLKGQPIHFYSSSEKTSMLRDYTYVDDIVSGIVSAIDYTPKDCGEKFNLGFGNPVKNIDMIRHIEEHLGLQANIERLPTPATEIFQTWADISESRRLLNFNPKTELKTGLKRFIDWYKWYHNPSRQRSNSTEHVGNLFSDGRT